MSIIHLSCIDFETILNISSTCCLLTVQYITCSYVSCKMQQFVSQYIIMSIMMIKSFLTYFIDIDDTLETARDENNDGNTHSIISISRDPGKSFLISMAYQSCISYTKYVHSMV